MRKHTWLLIEVGSLVFALSGVAAEVSSIALSIGSREYFGTEYAMPPQQDAPFMFYVGEPILVAIEFVNPADSPAGRLSFANGGLFAIEVRKDGDVVDALTTFEPTGELEDANGSATRALRTPISLNPGQRLYINGRIPSTLTPGVYQVDVSTRAVDGSGLPIVHQSTRFTFELRSPGDSDVIENTRRLAMRAAVNSDYGAAENSRQSCCGFTRGVMRRLLFAVTLPKSADNPLRQPRCFNRRWIFWSVTTTRFISDGTA